MPSTSSRRATLLRPLLLATLTAAVLDAAFSFVAYVVIDGRYNFESLLQYIASGLLGHEAFTHAGATGWLIAALGFALHIGITLTVVLFYTAVLRPLAGTRQRQVALGIVYGAAVWIFNTAVVLPLTGTAHEPFFAGWYIPFLIDHMLFVGLPVALILSQPDSVPAMGRGRRTSVAATPA
jgi:hypothetical protein